MDLNIPIQVNNSQGNEAPDVTQGAVDTGQTTTSAPENQAGDPSYARQVELANLISQAQTLDELKGYIKKAIEEGFANSSFLIEKATARKKELSENPSPVAPETVTTAPTEAPAAESVPETSIEPIAVAVEEPAVVVTAPIEEVPATVPSDGSETGTEAEIMVGTPEEPAIQIPEISLPEMESAEPTEVVPATEPIAEETAAEETQPQATEAYDITFANPNAEDTVLQPAAETAAPDPVSAPEAQALEIPEVAVSAPVVEMAVTPSPAEETPATETVQAAEESPETDPVLVHEKKLLRQFDSLMGELVVMAAESQIINDEDRKHAGDITEKLKKTWTDICEKRGKSVTDKESQYIFQIIGQQISKINNK